MALLASGLVACFATPISAGYDEETHFIRAWEMAHLYFIPNEQLGSKLPFPAIYWELSYRRQPIVQPVAPGLWSTYGGLRMDAHDYVYANVETRSVYSPALLLPQALALRYLGLSLQLPALAVYYACRIAGLLAYLILGWLAVRLIPYGKWLLAVLIVAPMAVFQASTISADTISNGIGFLFVGASLAISVRRGRDVKALSLRRATAPQRGYPDGPTGGSSQRDRRRDIGWKLWAVVLGLLALLFLAKVNLIFLAFLPFLLISPARFKMKHGYALLALAALLLFLGEVGGWNVLAYSKFTRALEGANPGQQLFFILSNPLLFARIIAQDIWANTPSYMRGWIGVYGYDYWPVPGLTYLLYLLAVIACLRQNPRLPQPDKRSRIFLASLFAFGSLLTIASLYVAFTPVGSLVVAGVQGRYFTVVMPLLFLALLEFPVPGVKTAVTPQESLADANPGARYPVLAVALVSSALVLYSGGLLLSYHVSCGSEYYRMDLCYQPQYKNWAPKSVSSPAISPSLTLTQEIVPACNDMTVLRVWVNDRGADPVGTTTLSLRAPTMEHDLVDSVIRNADLPQGGWLTVRFSPQGQSANQLYLLRVVGSSPNGPRLGYSEKAEYLAGKLFENRSPMAQDLLFQYGCVAGLDKWLGLVK